MTVRDIILVQQRELRLALGERYIGRDMRLPPGDTSIIRVIIGPRRAGKSFFAIHELAGSGTFGYVNFDDERLCRLSDYDEIIAAVDSVYEKPETLLLDEVQNLPQWELFVNRLARQGYRLTITGSNSHLLSNELATHLTGRYLQTAILPFSFAEYLRLAPHELTTQEKAAAVFPYATAGGYPEPLVKQFASRDYLATLFDAIVYKDIVKRYRIRSVKGIEDLAQYLLSNIASEYSYQSLSRVTQNKSTMTAQKFVRYLEEAFLFFSVPRFSFKVREQAASNKKIYCTDTGFVAARAFAVSENRGKLLENLVAIGLWKRQLAGDASVYYWKSPQQEEVDFVVKQGNAITALIQVCADLQDEKTRSREIRALLKASRDLSCDNLIILSMQEEKTETSEWFGMTGTIRYVPLWKWLEEPAIGEPQRAGRARSPVQKKR
ncbi:MAG: ATP-binding protein [Methanomicrobiales archaeon]|nr:ATP-binding protein [Methanomicrobiales archaeon]